MKNPQQNTVHAAAPMILIVMLVCLVLMTMLSPTSHAADVYKWTDEAGKVHYSDTRPGNVKADKIRVSGSKSSSSKARSPQSKASDLEARKQEELEAKAEALQSKKQKEQWEERCVNIRENLQTLNESSRVQINEKGSLRYMTPEEIEEKRKQYQQLLQQHCQ